MADQPAPVTEDRPSIGDRAIEKLSRQVAGLTQQLAITEAIADERGEQLEEARAALVAATAARPGSATPAPGAGEDTGSSGRP